MRVRSLTRLDLKRSWRHVLGWARGDIMDVPDRLPYELADRLWSGEPVLRREHEVQPVQLVMATKIGTQTIRPFVRPHVRDMRLFQSLIDVLGTPMETALPGRDTVFSYRLFSGHWRRRLCRHSSVGFLRGVHPWSRRPTAYVIRGELSSFS